MNPIEKAVSVRRLYGEEAEYFLYKYINKYPGLSGYELSKRLGWSYGKIRKALERLGSLIHYEEEKMKYPYKKLVYATNWYDIPDGEPEKSDTRNKDAKSSPAYNMKKLLSEVRLGIKPNIETGKILLKCLN